MSSPNTRSFVNQSQNTTSRLEHINNSNFPQQTKPSNNASENTRQVPPPLKHPSSSTGDLLPGIDLDAVALMMQGGKGNRNVLLYPENTHRKPI